MRWCIALMEGVRAASHDRARSQRFFAMLPVLPNSCKGERSFVVRVNKPRITPTFTVFGPLIKSARRDKAAPFARRCFKRGFFCNRFRTRVDQKWAAVRFFIPARDKPPSHRREVTRAALDSDRVHLGRRADVIIRHLRQIICRLRRKELRHCVIRKGYCKASTHALECRAIEMERDTNFLETSIPYSSQKNTVLKLCGEEFHEYLYCLFFGRWTRARIGRSHRQRVHRTPI